MGQLASGLTTPNSALVGANGQPTFVGAPSQVLARANAGLPSATDTLGTDVLHPQNNVRQLPSIGTPSYQQAAATGPAGTPNALSPGLGKLGKLVTFLTSGAQGALAGMAAQDQMIAATGGRRAGGVGTGFTAGYQLPWQRAAQQNQVLQGQAEARLAQMGAQPVQTDFGTVPAAYLPRFLSPMLRLQGTEETNQTRQNIANQTNARDIQLGNQANQTRMQLGRYQTTPNGLFDKQTGSIIPDTGKGIALTPEMVQQYGFDPNFIGRPVSLQDIASRERLMLSASPETTTTADSLGVTSTTTRQKKLPGTIGGPAIFPGQGQAGGGSPTSARPAGAPASGGGNSAGAIVDEIGQYRLNPSVLTRMMTKHPEILAQVQQRYPDWDQTSYNAKNKIATAYTSGPESRSIGAISTALGHAGELGDAIEALHNTNVPILNAIANRVGVATGDTPVTTYNTIVHRLGPEITAAYVQGGGGEGERAANAEDFSASKGDQQLRNNLGITVKLLRSKIAAQEQQWNNTYMPTRPQDQFSTRFLTPTAQRTLQTWGGGAYGGGNRPPLTSFEH